MRRGREREREFPHSTGLLSHGRIMSDTLKEFTAAQVEQHCTHDSLWIIYDGKVYDMTSFYPQHPGGTALLRKAGKDVTTSMQMVQAHGLPWNIIQKKLAENIIGVLKRN